MRVEEEEEKERALLVCEVDDENPGWLLVALELVGPEVECEGKMVEV